MHNIIQTPHIHIARYDVVTSYNMSTSSILFVHIGLHTALFAAAPRNSIIILCTADNDRRPEKRSSKYGGVPTITRVPLLILFYNEYVV